MSRLDFQRNEAAVAPAGSVLNIGCGDDPVGLGASAVHVDIDVWSHPNFVQADCCKPLPFADKEFHTAVLGDVLEHCYDPDAAMRHAARVARRLVCTIPEEVALPTVGQHVELGTKQRADGYRAYYGYEGTDEEVIDQQKREQGPGYVRSVMESELPHDGHINRFDEAWVDRLVAASGMRETYRYRCFSGNHDYWFLILEG